MDGSFVENKEPDDLDVVTLLGADEISEDKELAAYALGPFTNRDAVKKIFEMDGIIVDMDGDRGVMLDRIGFLLTLFSHRREDFIWKGILSIPIASADNDDSAEGRIQQLLGIGGGT